MLSRTLGTLAVVVTLSGSLAAQATVTAADLARLETTAGEIDVLAGKLEKTDAALAADVRALLKDAAEEIVYLKVKLRRDGRVTREEYGAVRDKLDALRLRAEGKKVAAQPAMADDPAVGIQVPAGTEFEVRLATALNSGRVRVEQRFEADTFQDVFIGSKLAIPSGATARGFVSSVRPAGRIDRRGSLTLSFDDLRIDNRTYRLRASVTKALDPKMGEDASRIGAGAVVGGIVGGLLGGGKGALLGVLIGGGGTIAATEGADVDLPVGTVLRIRLDQPLEIVR